MEIDFTAALDEVGPDSAFRLMNDARPPADYVFAQFLPERTLMSYEAKAGSMTIRSVMAGLVGMDSPYPEGALVDVAQFLEQLGKMAHSVVIPEQALRTLQMLLMHIGLTGGNTTDAMVEEVLNFTNALLIQPHLDATEWLRGQVFAAGMIDWTFNNKRLLIDYGVPADNKFTARTGTSGYGGSASTFWQDHRAARRKLRNNVRAIIGSTTTVDMIVENPANSLQVINESNSSVTIQRLVANAGGGDRPSSDARDTTTIIKVDKEGEILDPANPGKTKIVPFYPDGKLTYVGNNTGTRYAVGAGSRQPVDYELGYTHIGPTVEGKGRAGRWARVFTPERRPWQLVGESAANLLPVLEAPEKLVILTTAVV